MNTHHRQFETWINVVFSKNQISIILIIPLQPVKVQVFIRELTVSH
jgi:hypothetical protein